MSTSKRGRKLMTNLPPNRARDVQRAFRARRAAHLEAMEQRINELEEENDALRAALRLPKANRSPLGKGPTGKDKPRNYASQSRSLVELGLLPGAGGANQSAKLDSRTSSSSPPSGAPSIHNTPPMAPGLNGHVDWNGQSADRTSRGSVSPPMTASSHTSPLMTVHKPLPGGGQYTSYVSGSPRPSLGGANTNNAAGQMYPPSQPQPSNTYTAATTSHDSLASASNGNSYNGATSSRMSADYSNSSYASGLPAYTNYSTVPLSQVPTPEPRSGANDAHRRSSSDLHNFRGAPAAPSYHSTGSSGAPTPIPSFSHLAFNGRDLTHSPAPAHSHHMHPGSYAS